jgi:hypothetical protein
MSGGEGRLILGYDGGCSACSELAGRIEEKVGGKLEVLSLHDPLMANWREEALGGDAPWVPTLVEVGGEKAKVWVGWRMGVALIRRLGAPAAWEMMRILGGMGEEVRSGNATSTEHAALKSRRQFLKGAGGVAVALSIMFGVGSMAAPASAVESKGLRIQSTRRIKGKRLDALVRRIGTHKDMRNVLSQDELNSLKNRTPEEAQAYMHRLASGNYFLAVAVLLDGGRVAAYRVDRGVRRDGRGPRALVATEAMIYQVDEDGKEAALVAASQNGQLDSLDVQGEMRTAAASNCGNCTPRRPKYRLRTCVRVNIDCAGRNCYACLPACVNAWSCAMCLVGFCPRAAQWCCRQYGVRCRKCCCTD